MPSILFDDFDEQELDNIKEDSVEGAMSRAYGSKVVDRNSDLGKAIRNVDLLNNKLKRGEISKEEFNKQFKDIKSNYIGDDIDSLKFLSAKHSKDLLNTGGRSSEEVKDSRQSKEEITGGKTEHYYRQDNMNDINKKKVERYLDTMASTDNYNDYKEAHKNLAKLLNANKGSVFTDERFGDIREHEPGKEDLDRDENTKLYHTSNNKDIDKLTPTYRSKDGAYYPNKRIYVGKDHIYSRVGVGRDPENYKPNGKTHAYEIKNPSKYKLNNDTELGCKARYIETDDKVPVKKFKESGGVMSILFDDLNEQEYQEALDIMYQNESESKVTNLFEQSFEDRLDSVKNTINEDTEYFLTEEEMKRSELPDSVFGVPEQRKYPLNDEKHVRSAIKLFNYVEPKYEAELARNIKKKMKQYNITDITVGEKNRFSKYYTNKKAVNEEATDKEYTGYDAKSGWMGLDESGRWILFATEAEYEEYLNNSEKEDYIKESDYDFYYTRKDALLEELGEFITESKVQYLEKDSKIVKMPKICPKCGSKMGIFIQGEPVCLCTNKDCKYYAGTVAYNQSEAGKKFKSQNESSLLESDNVEDEVKDKAKGKPSPISSEAVKAALESANAIPDTKKRSVKLRSIMASTVGKLSAKIKYIFGNLKLYDQEYEYDGYIRELFPKYLDELTPKDLYKLKESIMEHAFTTGRGHKSLKDVLNTNQMSTDKDNYMYALADKVRKDLAVLLHTIDAKYEKARFDGAKPYNSPKEEPKEEKKEEKKSSEENKEEEPKKKRKSYWDVDVSEEDEDDDDEEVEESAEVLQEFGGIKLPKNAKQEFDQYKNLITGTFISPKRAKTEDKTANFSFKAKSLIPVVLLADHDYLAYNTTKKQWCIVKTDTSLVYKFSDSLKHTLDLTEACIITEKAKIKGEDNSYDNTYRSYKNGLAYQNSGFFKSNLKFKGARVMVAARYEDQAEAEIKDIGKAFKNVEKSYSNILESVANEMYNEWSKDHGEKLSRKDFCREIYKCKLQNEIISYKDDYGTVFEFNYSLNPNLGARKLVISIYTDMDDLVSSYKYELESSVRRF